LKIGIIILYALALVATIWVLWTVEADAAERPAIVPGWNLVVSDGEHPAAYIARNRCVRTIYQLDGDLWRHYFADWPDWRQYAWLGLGYLEAGTAFWAYCDPTYAHRTYIPALARD
jgi:hypothetical protein